MDRRRFLKELGLGSVGAASFAALANALAVPTRGDTGRHFHLLAVSAAGPEGGPKAPRNQIFVGGDGAFHPERAEASGGGFYVHFLFPGRIPLPGEFALPVIASGIWKAKRVVKYDETGFWGLQAGGNLTLVVDLTQQIPSRTVIAGALLEVFSNPPYAGLPTTDRRIGYTLSLPGTDFSKSGRVGPFAPLDPPLGVAAFTIAALR